MWDKFFRSCVLWCFAMVIHVGNMCYAKLGILIVSNNYTYNNRLWYYLSRPVLVICILFFLAGFVFLFHPSKQKKEMPPDHKSQDANESDQE